MYILHLLSNTNNFIIYEFWTSYFICKYVYISIYVCMCIYIYMYVYVYIYIFIYLFIYFFSISKNHLSKIILFIILDIACIEN